MCSKPCWAIKHVSFISVESSFWDFWNANLSERIDNALQFSKRMGRGARDTNFVRTPTHLPLRCERWKTSSALPLLMKHHVSFCSIHNKRYMCAVSVSVWEPQKNTRLHKMQFQIAKSFADLCTATLHCCQLCTLDCRNFWSQQPQKTGSRLKALQSRIENSRHSFSLTFSVCRKG